MHYFVFIVEFIFIFSIVLFPKITTSKRHNIGCSCFQKAVVSGVTLVVVVADVVTINGSILVFVVIASILSQTKLTVFFNINMYFNKGKMYVAHVACLF